MNLRASLTRNWTLKLTSLALALVLWLMAAADEPGTTTLPVRIAVQAPPGRTLLHPPEPVNAIVTGPRGDLLRLASERLVVIRTLPDTATRSVELEIGPNDVDLPGGLDVRVHDVYPRRLALQLDAVETREIPVRPLLRVPSDSGLDLDEDLTVEPATVEITGPREQVLRIDTAYTLPVDLDAGGPTEQRIRIDTVGFETVRVNPQVVLVRADVRSIGTRTLDGVPVHVPSAGSMMPAPATVSVVLQGDPSRLAALTADSVMVAAAPHDTTATAAPLRVLGPAGLRAAARPDTVRLLPR